MGFTIRKALMVDVPALTRLIEASVLGLQAGDYSRAEMEGALETVFGVDTQLIRDGTYFVVEGDGGVIAGCGGWSRRKTLYGNDHREGREDALLDPQMDAAKIRAFFVHPEWARRGIGRRILEMCETAARDAGFTRFELGATLTGARLYRTAGYVETEHLTVELSNGAKLAVIRMVKS